MKKHWLTGTLLGLSLALLLTGGVAAANASLYAYFNREPPCVECVPEGETPTDANVLMVTYGGWSEYPDEYRLCVLFLGPSKKVACKPGQQLPEQDPITEQFGPCACGRQDQAPYCGDLGEWKFDAWVSDHAGGPAQSEDFGRVSRPFLLLEVCPEVEVEFVPEPGTVLLLGSGLMGLAGYATLRWPKRD